MRAVVLFRTSSWFRAFRWWISVEGYSFFQFLRRRPISVPLDSIRSIVPSREAYRVLFNRYRWTSALSLPYLPDDLAHFYRGETYGVRQNQWMKAARVLSWSSTLFAALTMLCGWRMLQLVENNFRSYSPLAAMGWAVGVMLLAGVVIPSIQMARASRRVTYMPARNLIFLESRLVMVMTFAVLSLPLTRGLLLAAGR